MLNFILQLFSGDNSKGLQVFDLTDNKIFRVSDDNDLKNYLKYGHLYRFSRKKDLTIYQLLGKL